MITVEWCKPSVSGTILGTISDMDGFVVIDCDSCEQDHKALITGNQFKARNTVATKKENV